MKNLLCLLLIPFSFLYAAEAEHPELKAYADAEEGMKRVVIVLPERENEQEFKVEVFVGKMKMTDGVNSVGMGGTFTEGQVKGWGYPFYEAAPGGMMSTLMAPMPGTPEVERFVHMPGKLIRYNSRLPVVVYVPMDAEVRYRVWTAGAMKKTSN